MLLLMMMKMKGVFRWIDLRVERDSQGRVSKKEKQKPSERNDE